MDVSIIIVNYNTKEYIDNCLTSIYEHTKDIDFEIIVSDNGSTDGSIEFIKQKYPKIILIENKKNLGFGRANNKGLLKAKGKYVFYLNSDTVFLNNAVKYFFDFWEQNKDLINIGALGANLLDKNLNANHSFDESFPEFYKGYLLDFAKEVYGVYKLSLLNLFFNKSICKVQKHNYNTKKTGEVAQIIGADLFVKNNEFAKFDKNYFLYCEETDLQYKMSMFCKKRIIIDEPKIIHLDNGEKQFLKAKDIVHKYKTFSNINQTISQIYFFSKHGVPSYKIGLLKVLTLILWCSPFIFTSNKKYFAKLLLR